MEDDDNKDDTLGDLLSALTQTKCQLIDTNRVNYKNGNLVTATTSSHCGRQKKGG